MAPREPSEPFESDASNRRPTVHRHPATSSSTVLQHCHPVLLGIDHEDSTGYSVTGVGDINGDGIDDLLIGVEQRYGNNGSGESYVVFGSTEPFEAEVSPRGRGDGVSPACSTQEGASGPDSVSNPKGERILTMRKVTIGLVLAAGFLFAPPSAHAIRLCWLAGNSVDVYLTNIGGNVYEVNGIVGVGSPVAGTAILTADELNLGFGIKQAEEPGATAVVWQLTIDRVTLDGTGYFRWYSGAFEGPLTALSIPCSNIAEHAHPGDLSTGVQ